MIMTLSIVITTYNRKKNLLKLLSSIYEQCFTNDIVIYISDNHSNYNVEEAIINAFPKEFTDLVIIETRNFNIGMIGNISGAFLYPKSKWMWLLSDDDITTHESLPLIFNYINLFPEVSAFKFTDIYENTNNFGQIGVRSIKELLSFLKQAKISLGELIFMSNNIYNLEKLNPYLGSAFTNSYSYFPHIIPVLMALDSEKNEIKFISKSIVRYTFPEGLVSKNYLVSIYLGALSIADIPFRMEKKVFKEFIVFFKMNPFSVISDDFFKSDYANKEYLYKKYYYAMSKNNWSFKNLIIYMIYLVQIKTNSNRIISLLSLIKKFLKKSTDKIK